MNPATTGFLELGLDSGKERIHGVFRHDLPSNKVLFDDFPFMTPQRGSDSPIILRQVQLSFPSLRQVSVGGLVRLKK